MVTPALQPIRCANAAGRFVLGTLLGLGGSVVALSSVSAQARPAAAAASAASTSAARWARADLDWDAGRYEQALASFQEILAGRDSSEYRERIALLTGENWHTSLVAEDARAPRWSGDGRWIAAEVGAGPARRTRLFDARALSGAPIDIDGGGLVFSPDGRRAAWIAGATMAGDVIERDLTTGRETRIDAGGFRTVQLAYAADGASLYLVGAPAGADRSALFVVSGTDRRIRPLATADSAIAEVQVVPGGAHLVYAIGGRNPLGGAPGGAFARGAARRRFAVLDLSTGSAREFAGESPVVAASGRAVVYLSRSGGLNRVHRLPLQPLGEPERLHETRDDLAAPAPSPDGREVVFQQMPREDWELYLVSEAATPPRRLTREIQHDLLPRFLDDRRILAVVGEARHRRAQLIVAASGERTRLFHNNTVRTIAPEYEWVPSPDATRVLVVAERDGDTVTPHRHLWLVDLTREVTVAELRGRVATELAAERRLRAEGERRFAPIADAVRAAVAEASIARVYRHEKALFDFDSKHVTQPGNQLARDYLLAQYRAFGLETAVQPFEARVGVDRPPVPTANILGVLRGTEHPELVYVVSSHFDSRAEGPGADDNTSGTAALLEAARVLASRPQPATIIFASFTGEESGLLGSREFVRRAKADGLRLVGALNNDMLGWSNDHRLDNTIRYSNPGIRDLQHAAAMLFTRMITYDAFYYKSTDAAAFYDGYGDIVGGIGSYPVLGNPHYHQPHDILEVENHDLITEASKTTIASLMLLASSPSRITGVQVARDGGDWVATWTPSPESGIVRYLVRYGPPESPEQWALEVTTPRAVLPNAAPGMSVAVKAVNRKGLDGWDWGRAAIR